ncbi:TolC family protein [Algibacter amylolyticus]|uniref:TolC family protein n=1 Tax=Algibacter amylolyticus TaxID=1608400 RepID=A0A5M7AVR4_9FLAO|nr:TolC family protein [Algibacter amylolyticus]KAA5821422.1 TolC family protein [Algibacter amylolyticus]MBB5268295.1 outer membrane protein [Algibacter amylolyticus]TSJ72934.1 TolC family protein [Algibacter amylolyticus]
MKIFTFILSFFFMQIAFAQETQPKVWSLQDCIDYALEHNISVKDAILNKNSAEVDYSKAKSSRLPDLFGNASQSFSSGSTIDPITSDYVTDQIHSTNVGINSSVTLFQGNQISNQIKQNKILLDQSIFQEEVEKNNIVLNILETYLQTLYSKENIAIAENNLEASEKEVLRAKARLDAGTIALSDYSEAQSQAATNKYNVIAAKNDYQQYIIALKQLLELSPMDDIEIETFDDNLDLVNLQLDKAEVYNNALDFLPEIQSSMLNIAANEKALDIAKGGYLPTLSLIGSIGSGYTSISDNTFSDQFDVNFNQKLGLSLTIPIFNRNQTKAAVKTATINIEKAEIQKQSTEKEVYRKVETAYQNAVSAQEQVIASEASKTAAEQSYKLAQKKYELGDLSTTDLVISQNTYTNAQQNYLQAKYLNILYNQLLQFYQGNDIKL